jgi:hypothetical protein
MNLKKIGLFTLFFIIGIFSFGLITIFGSFKVGYVSLFLPLFFIVFVMFFVMMMKEYSNKKLIVIVSLIVVYWLIIVIPFPKCDSWSKWGGESQTCTCIGINKYSFGISDAGWSQCVGIPINYKTTTQQELFLEQISQQILNNLEDSNKKLGFQQTTITINKNDNGNMVFGVKNIKETPLIFTIKTEVYNKDGKNSTSFLSFDTPQPGALGPLEKSTYNLNIKSSNEVDTFIVKLMIVDQQASELIYEEGAFFVKVVE